MATLDLVEGVAHRLEEVRIRRDDCAIHLELDDGLRPVERVEACGEIVVEEREVHYALIIRNCASGACRGAGSSFDTAQGGKQSGNDSLLNERLRRNSSAAKRNDGLEPARSC